MNTGAARGLVDQWMDGLLGCSTGTVVEKFGWFEGILEEFVREKYYSG